MAVEPSKPEERMLYEIEELGVIATDPYTKKRIFVRMLGTGTCLIEPVLRKTEAHPKTPKFDGNQAGVTFSITEKNVTEL